VVELPEEVRPRVQALARQWCADLPAGGESSADEGLPPDLRVAQRLAERLRSTYPYSLDLSQHDPSRDGVEDFLFHVRRGHCEYFASAHAVMCALLGVRVRLVSGFHVDGPPRPDGAYLVRERHAHAWTEVYTPRTDWVTFDPTPADEASTASAWWQGVRDFWDRLERSWRDAVTGYDAGSRATIALALKRWARAVKEAAAAVGAALGDSFTNLLVRGYVDAVLLRLTLIVGAAGVLAEVLYVVHVIRHHRRIRRHILATYGVTPPQLAFFRRLLALLERRGLRRRPSQTYREYAVGAAAALDLPARDLAWVVDVYYQMRWASLPVHAEQIAAAEQRVASLAGRMAGKAARRPRGL